MGALVETIFGALLLAPGVIGMLIVAWMMQLAELIRVAVASCS
jgi:hypothetical protein